MAFTIVTELGFATAEDGARLDRTVYVPDPVLFPGPRPGFIIFTSSGFSEDKRSPQKQNWLADLATRGIIAYAPTVRLDDPAHWIPGQTVNGTYPTQINDAKRAVLSAYADTRCDGRVMVGGGSGGASLAAYLCFDTITQVTPVAWDTTQRPLGALMMSAFVDFSDRTPDDNLNYVISVVVAFTETTESE